MITNTMNSASGINVHGDPLTFIPFANTTERFKSAQGMAQTVRTVITARIPERVTNLFLLITRNCVTETSMVFQASRP